MNKGKCDEIMDLAKKLIEMVNEPSVEENPGLGLILILRVPDETEGHAMCLGFSGGSKEDIGRMMNQFIERNVDIIPAMISDNIVSSATDADGKVDVGKIIEKARAVHKIMTASRKKDGAEPSKDAVPGPGNDIPA